MRILAAVTVALFALFMLIYKKNKARLISGAAFLAFLLSGGLCYTVFAVNSGNNLLIAPLFLLLILLILFAAFGVYIAIALFFLNARIVFKKERRSLANSLTLIAGLLLSGFVLLTFFIQFVDPPQWLRVGWGGIITMLTFYFMHLLLFLTTLLLCNLARPRLSQDYIIVLGSGLIRGKVPPLLAARINRAIDFAAKQQKKKGTLPKIIMSGGQGGDESRSEASAMREYALEQGFDPAHILTEEKSKSTQENMLFSREIIESKTEEKPYSCIFATNNYHLLRAAMLSRKAGLRIDGIGAKTALYYLPNALLREYIAFLSLHKKAFLLSAAALFLLGALTSGLMEWLLQYTTTSLLP